MRRATTAVFLAVVLGALAGACAGQEWLGPDLSGAYAYDSSIPLEASEDAAETDGEFSTQRVVFASVYGERISALLVSPAAVQKPPVLVYMHGLACSKDDAKTWAKMFGPLGIAVFAIDMPCHGERAERKDHWRVFRDRNLGPIAQRRTVVDNLRALDYLRTREDLDASKVLVLGGSLGAVLAGIVAGVDPGVAGLCLISGGATPGPEPGTYAHLSDPAKADLDVTNFIGLVAPRPVLLLNGNADRGVPIPCAEALYWAAGEPKELFLYAGGHVPGPKEMETNGGAARIRQWVTVALGRPATTPT